MNLKVDKIEKTILTHQLTPIGPLPTVLDPDGVYPYQSYCETSRRPVLQKYSFIQLENKFIQVLICQELGGKAYSMIHKGSGKEVLYVPGVIRSSRILPRFSFVAGGIEVSFPISHTPSLNEKVCHEIVEEKERIYVSVGETELRYGMQWTVEFSLGEHDEFLTQRTIFYNPTNKPHPWMSWSNAAVPAYPDSEFHFPGGEVLIHSDELKIIDWRAEGPGTNADIDAMAGYFWRNPDVNAFGCFSPSQNIGVYHIANKEDAPGIKLWSYGNERDLDWSYLHSLNKQSYVEIQAGPIIDQSIKQQLSPGDVHHHREYWIPSDLPIDINKLKVPNVNLRNVSDVPLFSFARKSEVEIWQLLAVAYQKTDASAIPNPPDIEDAIWPPGGLPTLENPFKWAIENDSEANKSVWQLFYGVWLLDLNRVDEGIQVLHDSGLDMANSILGRVYFRKGFFEKAATCYDKIKNEALSLHPQIVVERDRALAAIGKDAVQQREYWLEKVNALDDEFIIERKIDLLIDKEQFDEAKSLLLGTKFQKIHQRYERKKLWEKLCHKTNRNVEPYPENLGEDNLTKFGKYREFE